MATHTLHCIALSCKKNLSGYLPRKSKRSKSRSIFSKWGMDQGVSTFVAQSGLVSYGPLNPLPLNGCGQISPLSKTSILSKDILGSKNFIKHVYLPLPFEIENSNMVEKL